jgi:hypothetical protein
MLQVLTHSSLIFESCWCQLIMTTKNCSGSARGEGRQVTSKHCDVQVSTMSGLKGAACGCLFFVTTAGPAGGATSCC